MHKLPSTRKYYRVSLIVPDNGIPVIEYYQARGSLSKKKPRKTIHFVDLWFADKKHDTNEKNAFSIYTVDKTITFFAQDETTMNDWLTKIREYHSELYPELTQYDAIFEATLLDKGLAKTMGLQGHYRLALCKESLDLVPLLSPQMIEQLQQQQQQLLSQKPNIACNSSSSSTSTKQRFSKRHPWVTQKTIQLARRSIRRCGHTDSNFYIESGRHSTIGEGDLWFALNKKSTARHLHELLLATIMSAASSQADDQFLCKAPRSRSGSSSESALDRSQQSRSSSLMCLINNHASNNNNNNNITFNSYHLQNTTRIMHADNGGFPIPTNPAHTGNEMEDDGGYLPMA